MYDPEQEDYDDDDYNYYPEEWSQLGKANSFNIDWTIRYVCALFTVSEFSQNLL